MTTNLTTRSAQAATITAVPPRSVPQGTQTAWFTRLPLLALLACVTIPLAHAQVTYNYEGPHFNAYQLSIALQTPTPFAAGKTNQCAVGTKLTFNDGTDPIFVDSVSAVFNLVACTVTTNSEGQIIGWDIADGNDPFEYFCSDSTYTTCSNDLVYFPSTGEDASSSTVGGWIIPTPQNIMMALLLKFTGGVFNLTKSLGTSLTDQLTTVLTDLNNNYTGQACTDLQIFANHVKAQKGKAINSTDAATIMQWVGWIAAAIPGCQIN